MWWRMAAVAGIPFLIAVAAVLLLDYALEGRNGNAQ